MELTIRPATEDDCRFVHTCRNHPNARAVSGSKDEIPFASHQQWYSKALANPGRHLYIASDESLQGEQRVGNLRFDDEDDGRAEISVSVNPEMYGRGYGTATIRQGSERYLRDFPGRTAVRAEIEESNPASIKAFEKAGYVRIGKKGENREYEFKLPDSAE